MADIELTKQYSGIAKEQYIKTVYLYLNIQISSSFKFRIYKNKTKYTKYSAYTKY